MSLLTKLLKKKVGKEVLRKATMEDARFLLESHNSSRDGFLNSKVVLMDEHLQWLKHQVSLPHIYVCEVDGWAVGSVRAKRIRKGWELHWEILPEDRGKGYATIFTKNLASLLSGKLIARIRPDNLASVKVAEALGMKYEKDNIYTCTQ